MIIENAHLTRQADIIPTTQAAQLPITIIGAGAIGSWTALTLAKSGFTNLTVYDFDTVSIENMSSQGYRFADIGKPKVDALADIIAMFTGITIKTVNAKWSPNIHARGIVIAAADSMETRRYIYESIKSSMFQVTHMIDARMGAEIAALYTTRPHAETWYDNTLYSDSEAVQAPCTAKATIYTSNLLSGLVVKTVKDILVGAPYTKNAQWNIKDGDYTLWRSTVN